MQFYTLNLILLYFDHNIDKCRPFLANHLLFFVKITKNAVFALCCEILIVEVGLRFNLVPVQKCHFTIAELRCASTELKSL